MKITRGREGRPSVRGGEHFTGTVWQDVLLDNAASGARVYAVFFEPAARTHWHAHERGQVLYVTSGQGRVGTKEGVQTVGPGDLVHSPAGEEHWHGGGPETVLHHVAISLGETRWGPEVTAEEYG